MYQFDRHERQGPVQHSGAYLSPEEIREMSELMYELRSITLSRRTYKAATTFLTRFAGETSPPSLVPSDAISE